MRLFIGNLPFSADERDIGDFFARHSIPVSKIHIPRDKSTEQGKGFAFAEVPDNEGGRAISELNGQLIQDRKVRVDEAKPPKPR